MTRKLVYLNGKMYYAYKTIWFKIHGEYPKYIDHINGIKDDNRLCNLRSVSHDENCRNRPIRVDNEI